MPRDPTAAVSADATEKRRRKALAKAGQEHESGRPGGTQARVDGTTPPTLEDAEATFKDRAAIAKRAEMTWKLAQQRRDVRLDDLVKAHAHKPFDRDATLRISREAAKAVEAEKSTLEAKQEAQRAAAEAWKDVEAFNEDAPVRSMMPEEGEDPEQ